MNLSRERGEPTLIALLLALVAATSGSERGLFVAGLKLSDLLLVAVAILILLKWGGKWRLIDGLGVAVLTYAFAHAALTIANFSERPDVPQSELLAEVLAAPQYLLLYLLAYAVGQKSGTLMTWLMPSMVIASLISVVAVFQIVDLGPTRELLAWFTGNDRIATPFDWQVYRGSGLFPSWHALGMYLCIHVVIASACLGRGEFSPKQRRGFVWMISLGGLGILTTATATPIIVASVAVLVFIATRRTAWIVALVSAVAAGAAVLTPLGSSLTDRFTRQFEGPTGGSLIPQSLQFRVDVWERDFLPIISAHLWNGYGPIDSNSLFSYTESMYITLLLRGGLPLLLAFVVLLTVAFIRTSSVCRLAGDANIAAPARALRYLIVVLAAFMAVHPYLNDAGGAAMFFTSLGVISGLAERRRVSRREGLASRIDGAAPPSISV